MTEFKEKIVVITGGGGGIGRAAAASFLAEGARVVLSSRRRSVLEAARAEIDPSGSASELVEGDVSSAAGAGRLIHAALDRFGSVDVLVNSTGIFRSVPFLDQTEDHVEEAPRLHPPPDVLHVPGDGPGDARPRRGDRERRLHVGRRRDHRHAHERVLRGPGGQACSDEEPRRSSSLRTGSGSTPSRSRSSRRRRTSAS